jgi:hypothetical protein
MAKDVWFRIPSSQYGDAVVLSIYNGKISVCAGNWKKDADNGGAFLRFAKYKNGRDSYMDKDLPIKVSAGDPKEAIYLFRLMADVLEGKVKPPEQPKPYVKSGNTPAAAASVMGGTVVDDGDINF